MGGIPRVAHLRVVDDEHVRRAAVHERLGQLPRLRTDDEDSNGGSVPHLLHRSTGEGDVGEEVAAVALVRHGARDAPGDHLVPPRGHLRDVRRLLIRARVGRGGRRARDLPGSCAPMSDGDGASGQAPRAAREMRTGYRGKRGAVDGRGHGYAVR